MALARASLVSGSASGILASSLLVVGCGDPVTYPPIDANFPDAAIVHGDAGVISDPCDEPMAVSLSLTEPTSVMLDTSMTDTRPRDLGLACGNVTALYWARQQVIEVTVPGTGPLALNISTETMETSVDFHTVVQVRSACTEPPTDTDRPTCFEGGNGEGDWRSSGGLMVMGGETLFIYVTGYSDPPAIDMSEEEGPVRVTFELSPNTAPTVSSGRFILTPTNDIIFEATGTDAERAPASMVFGLYGAGGGFDFDGDGMLNYFRADFERTVGESPNFTGVATVPAAAGFGEICRMYGCTSAAIAVFDHAFLFSGEVRAPMVMGRVVAAGAACDSSNFCAAGLVCDAETDVCGEIVDAGETCDATHFCNAGLGCSATTMTCVDAAAIGESCASAPCESGLDCDGTTMTCVMTVGVGVACDATHVCDTGLTCSATTMLCEMIPTP